MPLFSTERDRLLHQLLLVEQLVGFLGDQDSCDFATVTRRVLVRPPPSLAEACRRG